jgi:hypothetical protein
MVDTSDNYAGSLAIHRAQLTTAQFTKENVIAYNSTQIPLDEFVILLDNC